MLVQKQEKFKGTIDIEEGILEGTSFLISIPHFEKSLGFIKKIKKQNKKADQLKSNISKN